MDLKALSAGFGCTGQPREKRSARQGQTRAFAAAAVTHDTEIIEEALAEGGQFDQFVSALNNVDGVCQNDETLTATLKTALLSKMTARKGIENAKTMNSTLIGKPPTAAEMRGLAKDREGIRAI